MNLTQEWLASRPASLLNAAMPTFLSELLRMAEDGDSLPNWAYAYLDALEPLTLRTEEGAQLILMFLDLTGTRYPKPSGRHWEFMPSVKVAHGEDASGRCAICHT